ncbi:OLC1v1029884C1 [Oldenlandia corymbosa var. corymbosa]|uniref:OLC1v1029884C1 n=1 Tax=Oldenlandia corymbosa var. corymbosa TaxID=529605 RepID=A0AAV1CFI1_OLDCO|nr:OLC1v1029884C1 [Oldenlandia corymbosa var. corymbosa]
MASEGDANSCVEDGEAPFGFEIRKRANHRHSPDQIQQLDAFFRDWKHPDERDREALSQKVGLTPNQIKYWFQNRRAQTKAHQEKLQLFKLKNENYKLKAANFALREACKKLVSAAQSQGVSQLALKEAVSNFYP